MSIAATSRGGAAHWNGPRMGLVSCDGSRCTQAWANIRHWQTNVRQPPFRDIAYNHGVCPGCGRIHVGRDWGARSAANGTNAGNSEWHAWMVMSGEGEPFTDHAKRGLLTLHAEHRRRYGRSRLTTHHAVRAGTTACPGPVIRSWVAAGAPAPTGPAGPAQPAAPAEEDDDMPAPKDWDDRDVERMQAIVARTPVVGTDHHLSWHVRRTEAHATWLRASGIPAVLDAVQQAVKACEAAASGDTVTAGQCVADAGKIAERVRRELADALAD